MTQTILSLAISSTEVTIKEDLVVFDGNAIVAAVGGAMGLFLGFSFYGCIMDIYRKIIQMKLCF